MSTKPPAPTLTLPDEAKPEGVAARRKLYRDWELADLKTLGPCPPHLQETTIEIPLSDGSTSRTIVVRPASQDEPMNSPLIVYIHGGGFSYSTPSVVLSPARAFASLFGAIVACPSYKLTPENPFPAPVKSAWEAVAWLSDAKNLNGGLLQGTGVQVNLAHGFVLAGFSAGGNLAAAIAGVAAADRKGGIELLSGLPTLKAQITGLFLSVPKILHEEILPAHYKEAFSSRRENANSPIIDATVLKNSESRLKPEVRSPWYSPVNLDLRAVRKEHPGRVYFQAGDLDILRDDAVVYERILRDLDVAETKIDVLEGYGHIAWVSYPFTQAHSEEIREKTLNGMAWLLGKSWDSNQTLPY